jgi:agmatine deiminase
MHRWLSACLVLMFAAVTLAQPAPLVPQELLDQIRANDPQCLPRYMTPEEALLPLPTAEREGRTPPSGAVYCPPEYAHNDGIFMAWKSYTDLLTQMTVGITTEDDPGIVHMVVDNSSVQSSAAATLTVAGADMSKVDFIIYQTNTVWIRDYGPRFILEDGAQAIIDHTYNRPRPQDDAFNDFLSGYWGTPQYDIGLTHGGGNFHLFANGDAFMSSLILAENPGLTEADIIQRYHDYQNVNVTIYEGFPTSYDSTRHIDMWMLPVDDWKVIIGQYSSADGAPYTITEGATADMTSRGYTVYRTPGWRSGGTHYTYTNAVIFNDQVFMSRFNVPQDAEALAVFQEAFPDKTIYQLDSSSIITAAGAMHCIVMHMPTAVGLYIGLPSETPEFIAPQTPTPITVRIESRGETYVPDSGLLHYRLDGGEWLTAALTPLGDDLYEGVLPAADCGDTPEFFFSAVGDQGTVVFTPSDAPDHVYSATIGTVTTALNDNFEADLGWSVWSAAGMISGMWQRAVPGGWADGSPPSDYDGSGQCYVTDNRSGYDVDGGPTQLTSPLLDLADATDPVLRYARWFTCDDAVPPAQDFLDVEVSNDDGATWVLAQHLASDAAWHYEEVHLASFVTPSAQMRVRFSAVDNPNNSRTEAGVDAVWIFDLACSSTQYATGDLNCDGAVNAFDIDPFVLALTDAEGYAAAYPDCDIMNADANGDGAVNAFDIDPFVVLLTGGGF